jgi:hypothetical protein
MRRKLTVLSATLAVVVWAPAAAQTKPGEPTTPVQPTENQPAANQPAASQPAAGTPDEPSAPQSTAPGQVGTTPGQEQTTPGEASQLTPATSGQTPSGQATPDQAQAAQVTKATAADIKPGTSVYDSKGNLVGKIASVSSKGAVIDTGSVKATIPTSSFAKGEKGLVFGMTKAELEAAAKKSEPKPAKKPK